MRAFVIAVIIVAGCGAGGDLSEPEGLMEEVRILQEAQADAPPAAEEPETFAYRAGGRQSPFSRSSRWAAVQGAVAASFAPNLEEPRQYLERFPVDRIAMVGTLTRENARFGLVRVDRGLVHRVRVGDYLGQHRGRIQRIGPLVIELVELVPNGAGAWIERSRILSLARPSPATAGDQGQ